MLYIVDIQNEQEIPLDYSVKELLAHMPQTEEFADILTDCAQDRREICEDGTIEVTSPFGTGDDWITDFVGEITGKLVYQADSNCYVLDEQSIGVTWYDNLLKITEKSSIIVWIIYYTKTYKNEENR